MDKGIKVYVGLDVHKDTIAVASAEPGRTPVLIGSRVLFGPSVQIYAATHPPNVTVRKAGLESGKAVEIGDDVWIGGGAIICSGVRIGTRSVIGRAVC